MWNYVKTHYSLFSEKGIEYFKCRHDGVWKDRNLFAIVFQVELKKPRKHLTECYHVALDEETHTIAERLMVPCIVDIPEYLLYEKSVKEIMVMLFFQWYRVTYQIKDLVVNKKSELIPHLQFQVGTRAGQVSSKSPH